MSGDGRDQFRASADIEALEGVASRADAVLVDDCTHGQGGTYRGLPNGTSTPLAYFWDVLR
jgi:hypothetical protein